MDAGRACYAKERQDEGTGEEQAGCAIETKGDRKHGSARDSLQGFKQRKRFRLLGFFYNHTDLPLLMYHIQLFFFFKVQGC